MAKNLVEYLQRCDDAYYNSSNPLVSDFTYDALVETLRRLDPNHPYLKKVGAKVHSDKIGRITPMGTLAKYHQDGEILKWLEKEQGEILISPKYDGFAVELIYQKGNLISASTRGDGHVGEDVLSAVMRIPSVPIKLTEYNADYITVRGEAIIPLMHHDYMKSLGYSAMRNAVPGIVRSGRVDALGYVDFVAYEFIDGRTDRPIQRMYYKKDFIVEEYQTVDYRDMDMLQAIRKKLKEEGYYYELDGVVLKTREIKEDDLLHPDHMIAWKYKSNRETTVLRAIEYQMGLTGQFTPIGVFDEVEFQGAKLTRASLGNITRLTKEFDGLTIGSLVEVSRRGDIIPYIEELAYIEESGTPVEKLTHCPHCGTKLIYNELEPKCANKSCPEILRLQISQFVKSLGIKGIGDKLIRSLIDGGVVTSITDVYDMDPEEILHLPRQGQSSVDKWVALQEKKLSAAELLSAYPFLNLGRKIWDVVLSRFTYSEVLTLDEETLKSAKLKGLGESKVNDIISQVSDNLTELQWLGAHHHLL